MNDCLVVTYRAGPRGEEDGDAVAHRIDLDWTRCHYGGERAWFLCPGCQQRIAVLYRVQQGLWPRWWCRHCVQLPYASQCETPCDRLLRKRLKLRDRLGAHDTRPKGMYWRTWERLRAPDLGVRMAIVEALGVSLDAAPPARDAR